MKGIRKRRGVLLEYVVLMCSVLPLVFAASYCVYSLGGDFGPLGRSVVQLYQRIVTVVSLPIP